MSTLPFPWMHINELPLPEPSAAPPLVEGSRIDDAFVCIKALVYPRPNVGDEYKGPRFRPCEYPKACQLLVGTKVFTIDTRKEVGVVIDARQTPEGHIETIARLDVAKESIADYHGLAFSASMKCDKSTNETCSFCNIGLLMEKGRGDWSEISTEFSYV